VNLARFERSAQGLHSAPSMARWNPLRGAILGCCALSGLAALLHTQNASAADDEPGDVGPADRVSLRGSAGFGLGQPGVGARLGFASEYWLGDSLGVGLVGARGGQTNAFLFGLGSTSAFWLAAPVLTYRGRATSGRSYAMATIGAGLARVSRSESHKLCIAGCKEILRSEYTGYSLEATAGFVVHPWRAMFELSPVLRFEGVRDFPGRSPLDYMITVNVELGAGWR
jgi:hypothetical protein